VKAMVECLFNTFREEGQLKEGAVEKEQQQGGLEKYA